MGERSIADVLDAAADLIEPEDAWHQGNYVGPGGNCWCALGAIMRAGNHAFDVNDSSIALATTLSLPNVGSIADWNDAPERTQAEVVAKLREAALARAEAPHA